MFLLLLAVNTKSVNLPYEKGEPVVECSPLTTKRFTSLEEVKKFILATIPDKEKAQRDINYLDSASAIGGRVHTNKIINHTNDCVFRKEIFIYTFKINSPQDIVFASSPITVSRTIKAEQKVTISGVERIIPRHITELEGMSIFSSMKFDVFDLINEKAKLCEKTARELSSN